MSLQDDFNKLSNEFDNFKTWLLHNVVTLKEFSTRYNSLVDQIYKLNQADEQLQSLQQNDSNMILELRHELDNLSAPQFDYTQMQSAINQINEQIAILQESNEQIFNNIQDEIASMQQQIAALTVRLNQLDNGQ